MSTGSSKKMKTTSEDSDFEAVKRYMLECPHVPVDHPAIKAAVQAIEKEKQRMERDRKLQMKFSKNTSSIQMSTSSPDGGYGGSLEDSVVVVDDTPASPPPVATSTDDSADEMMEWQDVTEKEKESEGGSSFLGKNLVKIAINAISEHRVRVKSPVAAIAAVLHASLRSDVLGFSCTGIPQDECTAKGGFAAPVRELPQSQFLPALWDSESNKVALRYRKAGTGALTMTVEQGEDQRITVHLKPANSKEPSSQTLSFSLADHANLDSWNAALKTSSTVSPALHYKSLAQLLTNFCRTFDLGAIDDSTSDIVAAAPYVDNTVTSAVSSADAFVQHVAIHKSDIIPTQTVPIPALGTSSAGRPSWRQDVPSTLGEAFPGINPMPSGGDFASDLSPVGLRDPRFLPGVNDGRMGGNMMGPNHPMFQGGGMMGGPGGMPLGGPGSMQPRFDPIFPSGIDPNGGVPSGRRSNRPSRTGAPNPDHLPPPNGFGDNMFS